MKKKLLVLLIAVIPTLMPNLASAIAVDVGDCDAPTPPDWCSLPTHNTSYLLADFNW
jgi:hypothetical protein